MSDRSATPTEFRGPLYEQWGESMRQAALAEAFRGHDAAELRARLGIPTAADSVSWGRLDREALDAVVEGALAERGRPWPHAGATASARYLRDGNRTQYETAVFGRQDRLTGAVVNAADTRDPEWLDEAAEGVVLLCEQSTWSWPAHDDAWERRGFVLTDVSSPLVDLGAGEVVAQLAVADHVLAEQWDARWPGIRERIRQEAERRIFVPFQTRDDLWWLGYWRDVANWNPWILSNIVLAAVLLVDDTDRLAAILSRALESLDRFVASLPSDGAIDEGVAYWWQGVRRLLECLDTVASVTDGALDATAMPLIGELLRYPLRMQLGGDWYVNVADGQARLSANMPWQVPFRWGSRLGDRQVVDWARSGRRSRVVVGVPAAGLAQLMRTLADAEWRDATPATPPLPATTWLPSVQMLVCRAHPGATAGLTLAAKGGSNGENHNHKDVGSFILAGGGRPLLVDVGKPTYTAATFSARRYDIRAMQSSWHNAPAPRGLEQGEGAVFAASVVGSPGGGDPVPELILDLSAAYPLEEDENWIRMFRLVSARRAEIVDTWRLRAASAGHAPSAGVDAAGSAPAASVHLVASGTVEVRGGEVVVMAEDHGIRITTSAGVEPTVEEWLLDDPELADVWGPKLTRLTYSLDDLTGSLTTVIEDITETAD